MRQGPGSREVCKEGQNAVVNPEADRIARSSQAGTSHAARRDHSRRVSLCFDRKYIRDGADTPRKEWARFRARRNSGLLKISLPDFPTIGNHGDFRMTPCRLHSGSIFHPPLLPGRRLFQKTEGGPPGTPRTAVRSSGPRSVPESPPSYSRVPEIGTIRASCPYSGTVPPWKPWTPSIPCRCAS